MRIYICGAETLAVPGLDDSGEVVGDPVNAERYARLGAFFESELTPFFMGMQAALQGLPVDPVEVLESIAYDPSQQIACLLADYSVMGIPVVEVAVGDALATYAPGLIYALGGGLDPDPAQQAAIDDLVMRAQQAGVLIRDARNIG